ncbi:hypothetical protein [Nitrosomonas communis]|uniref:Uncharacterized protein n=1 Tax=Nitrosomonas communis TaxID=44574 RepID=A0A1I4RIW1_9PROT|nr:hypothetical protein [Nitrosomonas communis]SFM51880.1 hypothetical protein SAMN05421863_103312 [Nitrosomonas communis]
MPSMTFEKTLRRGGNFREMARTSRPTLAVDAPSKSNKYSNILAINAESMEDI